MSWGSMRHWIPLSVAVAGTFFLAVVYAPPIPIQAQTNGVPSSVTSPGFGGRAINGTKASVTSLGSNGATAGARFSTSADPEHHRPRHHYVEYAAPAVYAFPVPYAVDIGDAEDEPDPDESDANYQGGPTVFDRRGRGAESYVPPLENAPAAHAHSDEAAMPDPPQEPTVLVFKDGHKQELQNYAIIGESLFDLTAGHARKVMLADLDLDATRKVNDDHGVTFQLPPSAQAN